MSHLGNRLIPRDIGFLKSTISIAPLFWSILTTYLAACMYVRVCAVLSLSIQDLQAVAVVVLKTTNLCNAANLHHWWSFLSSKFFILFLSALMTNLARCLWPILRRSFYFLACFFLSVSDMRQPSAAMYMVAGCFLLNANDKEEKGLIGCMESIVKTMY